MLQRKPIVSNQDYQQDPYFKTPSDKPLNNLARNPHLNVDVVHGSNSGGSGQTNHIVEHEMTVYEIANGQSFFDDVQLSLDASKTYTFEVSGYSSQPLVQTSANRQDSKTVRVVVENQSGAVIPATPIVIKATSI